MLKRKLLYFLSFFLALFIWGGGAVYATPTLTANPNSVSKGSSTTLTATNCGGAATFYECANTTPRCRPDMLKTIGTTQASTNDQTGTASIAYTPDGSQPAPDLQVNCTNGGTGQTNVTVLGSTAQNQTGSDLYKGGTAAGGTGSSSGTSLSDSQCSTIESSLVVTPSQGGESDCSSDDDFRFNGCSNGQAIFTCVDYSGTPKTEVKSGSGYNCPPSDGTSSSSNPPLIAVTNQSINVVANLNPYLDSNSNQLYTMLISNGQGAEGSSVIHINFLGFSHDITLPFGIHNDDSISAPTSANSKGNTTFANIPALRSAGAHYLKLQLEGQGTPLCVFKNPIQIIDPSDVSSYICQLRPDLKGCVVGSGKMCTDQKSVDTAIGCVPTDPKGLIDGLLGFITRAAGGVALIIMAIASFNMITSQGNAEELKKAQEKFRDAVIGLLFIILAVTILQIIGVDILQIPGLTR